VKVVVDTNVPIVANKAAPQASNMCVLNCIQRLKQIRDGQILVLDNGWYILREYMNNLRSEGQPGAGDAFLKWVLTNKDNPQCCHLVPITPLLSGFEEFPPDPDLNSFDLSDRKFVAVAIAHPEHPPILNAVDSDWWNFREPLGRWGIQVEFICPDAPFI